MLERSEGYKDDLVFEKVSSKSLSFFFEGPKILHKNTPMSSSKELLALDLKKVTHLQGVPEADECSEEWEMETAVSISERSPEQSSIQLIGANETRMVTKSKLTFILLLIFTAAGCAAGTYWFTHNSNRKAFETAVSANHHSGNKTFHNYKMN